MSSSFPLFVPEVHASSNITPERIKVFYKIERILFSRLVCTLNREMNQSFEVFCFLFLLEEVGLSPDLIAYLVWKPDSFINMLADEIVVCLNFLYNKAFSTAFFVANTNDDHYSVIPMIGELTGGKLTLRFIHQNRDFFLQVLTDNMTYTCFRALGDLFVRPQPDLCNKELVDLEEKKATENFHRLTLTTTAQQGTTSRLSVQQATTHKPIAPKATTLEPTGRQEETLRLTGCQKATTLEPTGRQEETLRPTGCQEATTLKPIGSQEATLRPTGYQEATTLKPTGRQEATLRPTGLQEATYRPIAQQGPTYRPIARQGFTYRPIYRQVTIARPPLAPVEEEEEEEEGTTAEKETKEEEVAVDDRTVFLMFSRGYPITEDEVKVYFTRRFGDVIEAIVMQDLKVYEQPLFAKMVLKSNCASKMGAIVSGARVSNKFTINGKYLWARKYVPKNGPSASA